MLRTLLPLTSKVTHCIITCTFVSLQDFDWMNSNVPAARSSSGGGDGAANALIRIDNRGNKFLTYEKKLVNFFTPPSAMLPPHLRPLTDGADKQV